MIGIFSSDLFVAKRCSAAGFSRCGFALLAGPFFVVGLISPALAVDAPRASANERQDEEQRGRFATVVELKTEGGSHA